MWLCLSSTALIFEWRREDDNGLWLDDGKIGGPEAIRALQAHPWIRAKFAGDDSDDSEEFQEDKSSEKSSLDSTKIIEWLNHVDITETT